MDTDALVEKTIAPPQSRMVSFAIGTDDQKFRPETSDDSEPKKVTTRKPQSNPENPTE